MHTFAHDGSQLWEPLAGASRSAHGRWAWASAGASGGNFDLSGSLTRQKWVTLAGKAVEDHIANMGRLVEDMENQMRDTVEEVYFGKTKNVVNGLYKLRGAQQEQTSAALQRGLMAEMQGKLGK